MSKVLYTNTAQTALLVHNADTNAQEIGTLMSECCCGDQYVRLLQCFGTYTCGNCPTSSPSGSCDEDGDGSADYSQGVKYILFDDWAQGAKSFSWEGGQVPCDGTDDSGGGTVWTSASTTDAIVATTCGTAYRSAGLTSASDQANIKQCDIIGVSDLMTFQHLPSATPPAFDSGIDDGFFDILMWNGCDDHCDDFYYIFKECQIGGTDGLACGALGVDNCPDNAKDYYVQCKVVEAALGAGQLNNNLGKIFKLTRSGAADLCVVAGNTGGQSLICGSDIPYGCTTTDNSGNWAKGYKNGENLIYTGILGDVFDDCCNCVSGSTCSCNEFCQGNSSFSISFSGASTGSHFRTSKDSAANNNVYFTSAPASEGGPLSSGGQPSGAWNQSGFRQRDGSKACSKDGTCPTFSGSVTVMKPFDPIIPFPDCYAPFYSTNENRSSQNAASTDICFTNQNGCQKLVSLGKQETVVFRCVNCAGSDDPCNCADCSQGGGCQNAPDCPCTGMLGVLNVGDDSANPPDCVDVDVDDGQIPGDPPTDLFAWYPSCDDPPGFEDDWFISQVYMYCSAGIVPGQGQITKWRIEARCSWPSATGMSGHGCAMVDREANGAENPGVANMHGLKFVFEQDTASSSPEGQYSLLSTNGVTGINGSGLATGGADCVYPAGTDIFNQGGLSGSVFANLKATVS